MVLTSVQIWMLPYGIYVFRKGGVRPLRETSSKCGLYAQDHRVRVPDAVELGQVGFAATGETIEPAVTVKAGDKTVPESGYDVSYLDNVEVGKGYVTVTGKGDYSGTVTKTFRIVKAKQKISAKKAVTVTVKAKKQGKKKALAKKVTVDLKKKAKVSAKTKVTFKKANKAGGKKIAVSKKTGKVTLKKGLKAGTYKVKVKLTAPASANYKKASPKTITLKVKVK